MKVFATRGYDAATTREVAMTAGVSEQLIQRYFGGKAGLLLAIMQLYAERDKAGGFGTPEPGDTVAEEIQNFLMFHLERERRAGDFARLPSQAVCQRGHFLSFMRMFVRVRFHYDPKIAPLVSQIKSIANRLQN